MSYAQTLMDQANDIWERYYDHPFITQLVDGSLPRPKFRDYLVQDTLYLKEYTKVFAIAFVKADDIAVMRYLYADMRAVISDETQTHIAYLRDFGMSEADALAAAVKPPNRAYLDYMLQMANEQDWLAGYISTTPCALSYYHVAQRAKAAAAAAGTLADNYYRAWIDFYAGPEYQAIYDSTVAFVDQQTVGMTTQRAAQLSEIFQFASEHELAFWDMALAG
jgi:thiaminase/transcriptional activator TenA